MIARPRSSLGVVALLAAALAVVAAWPRGGGDARAEGVLALGVVPVPLDPSDPARVSVGPLRYLGGLELRSADGRFGGLSDLRVSPDGARLFAVSDCGRGFTATLTYAPDGRLAGLGDARLVDLSGPLGRPLGLGENDAESLVIDGALEVGFEGRARVQAYDGSPPFSGAARPRPMPAAVGTCGRNGGLEAMTDLGAGRRLLLCEARRGPSVTVPAWVGAGDTWEVHEYPLFFEGGWAGEPFRPTGAVRLPDGDVLVVERRFPPMGARLVRLSKAGLEGQHPLEPVEVARFEAPLTLDNFEGVDARRDASNRTLVYLLSDDNGCSKRGSAGRTGLQRTLLMLFALEG
ncbi:MAG TPA: esterase-like activity of phytase family protein [Vicinamibacteria bacterium]